MPTAIRRGLIVVGLSLLVSGELRGEPPTSASADGQGGIPPEVVAEYLYAVVQADDGGKRDRRPRHQAAYPADKPLADE